MAGYSNDSSGNGKSEASNGKGPTDPSIHEPDRSAFNNDNRSIIDGLVMEAIVDNDAAIMEAVDENTADDAGSGAWYEHYFRGKDPERTDKVTGECKKCMKIAKNQKSNRRHADWCPKRSKSVKKYRDDLQKYQAEMAAAAVANDSTKGGGGSDGGNNNNAEHTAAVVNNSTGEGGSGDGGNNNNAAVPGELQNNLGSYWGTTTSTSTTKLTTIATGKRKALDDSGSGQVSSKRGKKPAAGVKEKTVGQKKQHAAAAATTATTTATTGAAVEAGALVKKKTVAQKNVEAETVAKEKQANEEISDAGAVAKKKRKEDEANKKIAVAAVKAGAIAKDTQDDNEVPSVDDITGNVRIHPILRCKTLWDDLNPDLKVHLKTLQFTPTMWKDKTLPFIFEEKWKDICNKARKAAAAFGCDELSWNTWERSVFERPKLSITALESEAAKQKREEDAKKNQENDRSKADRNHYKAAPISTTKITIPAGKRILSDDLAQQFDRDRLAALWDAHAPGMRKDIEQRLEKYRGREEQMFADMAADSRDNLTRPWLVKVLTDFEPGNLPKTERILQEFLGREDELYLQHLQHHTSRTPASDDAEVDEDKEKEKPAAAATTADAANANADDRLQAEATKRKGEEDGTNFFLEKNWDDLPKTQQECAISLGHDKSSWNKRNKGKTSSTTKKKSTSLNRKLPIRPTTDNGRMDTTARGQADRALYWAHQWQHTSTYATEKARKARPMLVHGTCSFTKLKRVPVPGSRRINYQAEPMTKGKAIFMVDEYTARDPKKYGKLLLKYGQFLVDGNTERAEVVSDPNSYYNALYTARDGDAKAPRPNDDIIAVKEAERLAENN